MPVKPFVPKGQPLFYIRCSGCWRGFGFTDTDAEPRNRQYCSEWCAREPAVTDSTVRHTRWEIMYRYANMGATDIARREGVSPTAVYKVVNAS